MLLKPLKKPEPPKVEDVVTAPMSVDISIKPSNGGRVLTIELPPYKEISDELRLKIETERGKPAIAICDITGDLIFDPKNVNSVSNPSPDRKEFDGLTLSTRFLRELLDKIEKSKDRYKGEGLNGAATVAREARPTLR